MRKMQLTSERMPCILALWLWLVHLTQTDFSVGLGVHGFFFAQSGRTLVQIQHFFKSLLFFLCHGSHGKGFCEGRMPDELLIVGVPLFLQSWTHKDVLWRTGFHQRQHSNNPSQQEIFWWDRSLFAPSTDLDYDNIWRRAISRSGPGSLPSSEYEDRWSPSTVWTGTEQWQAKAAKDEEVTDRQTGSWNWCHQDASGFSTLSVRAPVDRCHWTSFW